MVFAGATGVELVQGSAGEIRVQTAEEGGEERGREVIRSCMFSGQLCDPNDPEELAKLSALRGLGIDIVSGFLTVSRPYALAPWVRVGGKITLAQHDERYWDHLCLFAGRCLGLGLGVSFQIVSKWWVREEGGTQAMAFNTPTGEWKAALTGMLKRLVPIVNSLKLAAILPVTEGGSQSQPMCRFVRETMEAAGISPFVYWISNSGSMPGYISSPHPHSVAAWTKGRITFGSTDGWAPGASEWKRCVQFQKQAGASAIEYWSPWLSSGAGEVAYEKRIRPTMDVIVRKAGAALKETGA
jgi:hypothetical protein